jgi:hypothetical protein
LWSLFADLSIGANAGQPIERDKVIHITARSASRLLFWNGIVAFKSGFPIHGALLASIKVAFPNSKEHLIGRVSGFLSW